MMISGIQVQNVLWCNKVTNIVTIYVSTYVLLAWIFFLKPIIFEKYPFLE